jgi:hypothetical protein
MVTGLDLKRLFEDKIDNSYSDYVSDPKMQRAFDNAFLRVIENKYRGLDTQKEFDELSELMVIDRNIIVNNNRFRTKPIPLASVTGTTFTFSAEHNLIAGDTFTVQETGTANDGLTFTVASITTVSVVETTVVGVPVTQNMGSVISEDVMLEDYLHVLAMKVDMYSVLENDTDTLYKIYNGTPAVVEFFRPAKIRSFDRVTGIILNNPSGTTYAKQISEFKYEIYSDKDLLVPFTVLNAPSTLPTVRASKIHSNWAKYLQSDRRISRSGEPTLTNPRFNQDRNFFLIHPQDKITISASVDYIRKPNINILVTDNSIDLSLFYSETLLNRLTDEAVKMFYQEVRDPNQYQVADREMIDNP